MQNSRLQNKPAYSIDAVDNALQLIQLLRDLGGIRLTDAAAELNVAPSTAHRLLAVLIYRGFAVQDESKRYLPGPAMGVGPADLNWTKRLRTLAQPHLELLASRLNETANLVIRVGTKVRFLSTVEGSNLLRVGDRQGTVLPAHRASGGKAMLAELDPSALKQLFQSTSANIGGDRISDEEYPDFMSELDGIRANGFAANFEGTEEGISALGVALHSGTGQVIGALSVATPAARFRRLFDEGLVPVALETRRQLELDIVAHPVD